MGANGLLIAEPAAGLISPAFCQTFSSDYVKRIVDAVQDDSFVTILHNCGNTTDQITAMLFTGAKALHFGNVVDMNQIMPQLPKDVIGFGNVDPLKVMKMGEAFDVKSQHARTAGADGQVQELRPLHRLRGAARASPSRTWTPSTRRWRSTTRLRRSAPSGSSAC